MAQPTEVWQRGPVAGIPPLLQPVAHALLQAREEINEYLKEFPSEQLWERPAGVASVGFHLQHLSGVLDRVFTYALGNRLSEEQFAWLAREGKDIPEKYSTAELLRKFDKQVDLALKQLSLTGEHSLTEFRGIGRAGLPSTVIGLLFHAAEHTMRHVGQLLVTAAILGDSQAPPAPGAH